MAVAKLTKPQQEFVDAIIAGVSQEAKKGLVTAASKPDMVAELRKTWRKSAEHKAAQIKRLIYSMVAVVTANIVGDVSAGKNPLDHFTDARTAWYYLLPFAYIAWKQAHPSMSASEADSAPGVTIVPSQLDPQHVDVPVDAPADPPVDPPAGGGDAEAPGDDPEDVPDVPDPAP